MRSSKHKRRPNRTRKRWDPNPGKVYPRPEVSRILQNPELLQAAAQVLGVHPKSLAPAVSGRPINEELDRKISEDLGLRPRVQPPVHKREP